MKPTSPILAATLLGLLLHLASGCATSPTGHRQLRLVPDEQMTEMGAAAYTQMKSEVPSTKNQSLKAYVDCVTQAITDVIETPTNWELTVFESDEANAFALPGGKIGVYTGLLKVADTPDRLAAVIGHEIAHVLAQHGNARVSAAYATQAGLQGLQIIAGAASPAKQQLFGLLGLGAQYGILLPYGRDQETEADVLGLDYMARAGFDPRQSVEVWKNMAELSAGQQPPVFLSTHPSHASRIAGLQERMNPAMKTYKAARKSGRQPQCAL